MLRFLTILILFVIAGFACFAIATGFVLTAARFLFYGILAFSSLALLAGWGRRTTS